MTDASTERYGGNMSNLSFRGQWPGMKDRETHINLLDLETVWKACQQFREEIKGKVVSFQIDYTMPVSYLQKDGDIHCWELNGLASKILLRCHRDAVTVCLKYILLGSSKSKGRCPDQREGMSGMELRDSCIWEALQKLENSSSGPICKQEDVQGPSVFQHRPLRH